MPTQPNRQYTPEEYLAVDRAAPYKSEYLGGEIFAMGGASPRHVLIVSNLVRDLGNQLRERPCIVYASDLRVQTGPDGMSSPTPTSWLSAASRRFATSSETR